MFAWSNKVMQVGGFHCKIWIYKTTSEFNESQSNHKPQTLWWCHFITSGKFMPISLAKQIKRKMHSKLFFRTHLSYSIYFLSSKASSRAFSLPAPRASVKSYKKHGVCKISLAMFDQWTFLLLSNTTGKIRQDKDEVVWNIDVCLLWKNLAFLFCIAK